MNDIKIDLYTVTYNEEFLAPYVLDYWKRLPIRKIVVYDNQSTDNTINILKQNNKVEIREFNTNNSIDDIALQTLKNNAWKESKGLADYVIMSDFDEIIYSDDICSLLNKCKINQIDVLDIPGIEFICEKINEYNPKKLFHEYQDMKFNFYDKPHPNRKKILFNPNTIKNMNFSLGAHFINPIKYNNTPIKYGKCNDIFMFHLKFITLKYILNRHHIYANRLSNSNKLYKLGIQYEYPDSKQIEEFNNKLKTSLSFEECIKKSYI